MGVTQAARTRNEQCLKTGSFVKLAMTILNYTVHWFIVNIQSQLYFGLGSSAFQGCGAAQLLDHHFHFAASLEN